MSNIKEDLRSASDWIALHGKNTNKALGTVCGYAADRLDEIEKDVDKSIAVLESAMLYTADNTFPGDFPLFTKICAAYEAVKDIKNLLKGEAKGENGKSKA